MRFEKLFSKIIVRGKTKSSFFFPSRDFSIEVFYSPIKNRIYHIIMDHDVNINFKIGDDISILRKWVIDNKYEIVYEKNRTPKM